MKSYLFISNSRKPSFEMAHSLQPYTVGSFGYAPLKAADSMGYKLYYGLNRETAEQVECTNFNAQFYNSHIFRDVFAVKDNWIAYKNLSKFLKDHPEIEVIHCNTPIGGILGRLCGYKFKKIVIYTVHGFHFYKGAPLFNNTFFKLVEKWLAHKTDCLITINQEDFEAAKKFRLKKGGKVYKVNGVGMDLNAFEGVYVVKNEKRKSICVPAEAVVGIVVGDLNENKNVETIIKALALTDSKIHLLLCGQGPLEGRLKSIAAELKVEERCHFLGFRSDVKELYKISDFFISASQREGLPRSAMEAMLAGLPCVVSKIRGNVDLIDECRGGFLFLPKDNVSLAKAMTNLAEKPSLRQQFGSYNQERIKQFDLSVVEQQILNIYKEVCK